MHYFIYAFKHISSDSCRSLIDSMLMIDSGTSFHRDALISSAARVKDGHFAPRLQLRVHASLMPLKFSGECLRALYDIEISSTSMKSLIELEWAIDRELFIEDGN